MSRSSHLDWSISFFWNPLCTAALCLIIKVIEKSLITCKDLIASLMVGILILVYEKLAELNMCIFLGIDQDVGDPSGTKLPDFEVIMEDGMDCCRTNSKVSLYHLCGNSCVFFNQVSGHLDVFFCHCSAWLTAARIIFEAEIAPLKIY